MDDTRRRFLATIVARVPLDRLVEVHLFAPIRQGGVETGVAVVAAELPAAPLEGEPLPPPDEVFDAPMGDPTEDASRGTTSPSAEPVVAEPVVAEPTIAEPTIAEPVPVDVSSTEPPARRAPRRHTVFTARYRMTIRGPDRGRWVADVVEEADAPLVTVEAVVRGVQRRAGDAAGPDRLGSEAVAQILGGAREAI